MAPRGLHHPLAPHTIVSKRIYSLSVLVFLLGITIGKILNITSLILYIATHMITDKSNTASAFYFLYFYPVQSYSSNMELSFKA